MWFKKAPVSASAKSSYCSRCGAVETAETTAVTTTQSPRTPKTSVSGKRTIINGKNKNKSTVITEQQPQQQQQQNVNKKSPQGTNFGKKATVPSSQQQIVNKKLQNNKVKNKINIHVVNSDSVASAIGCVAAAAVAQQQQQQPKMSNNTANAQALTLIVSQRFAMPRRGGVTDVPGSVTHPSPVCQQPMTILSR